MVTAGTAAAIMTDATASSAETSENQHVPVQHYVATVQKKLLMYSRNLLDYRSTEGYIMSYLWNLI